MALITVVYLQSRNTHEKKDTTKKRRRLASGDIVKNDDESACADLYKAAYDQLEQEMKDAGLEGSLPMSFGGGSKFLTSRQRKMRNDNQDEDINKAEEKQAVEIEIRSPDRAVVDKIRVIYNSDGEEASRIIEQVEAIEPIEPEVERICEAKHANSRKKTKKKKKKIKYPVSNDVVKFYVQRTILFEKFEEGIQLDHESWYSVTPQVIAEHIATRLACDVVIDPFSGCGGNVIQLAMTCKQVIAIDIDPEKIRMAQHNAAIYGVAHKIEFIVGNSIDIIPQLKADAIFLSPPWGGVKYNRKQFNLKDMVVEGISGLDLFAKARLVTKNIAYYLTRGTPIQDLEELTPGEPVECESIFLNQQLKVKTFYYGDLVQLEKSIEEAALSTSDTADIVVEG
ncbi:hypothetical protein CCR75_006387 [Bremia lactucae]|uniref:Trimethylguanosine synthase n=1 Tax=Bremia lactucae TaxID=4779 RepID=A0A976IJE3_BRELC|nr:hypothetical protein CCR75_006387 [Bremia lactucae]